jgi:polar amino acid transport system substrate-binding protein
MENKGSLFVCAWLVVAVVITSGCTQSVAHPGDLSLQTVMDRGKLVAGTYPNINPMTFKDAAGNNAGHDIDIAREIASDLGVVLEIKDMALFSDLFKAVKNGEVDIVISAITITPNRTAEMLFSIPYFESGQVIAVRNDYIAIKSVVDLAGKKIGVTRGTTGEKTVLALSYVDPSNVISFGMTQDRFEALRNGTIDASVGDYSGTAVIVNNDPSLKIAGTPFTQEYYGIATALGNQALMERINGILREMKRSDRLQEIKGKWFGLK